MEHSGDSKGAFQTHGSHSGPSEASDEETQGVFASV
jgi:hypothetical protein